MERAGLPLDLVEKIYRAVVEPDAWNDFLQALSEKLGGAAIQMSLRLPEMLPTPDKFFRVGLDASYHHLFVKHILEGLPWTSIGPDLFRGRFGSASEAQPDDVLEETPFYIDYMKPQGLAPEWPTCHVICTEEGRPLSGVIIYRREGCRPLDADDLAMLDGLVPHLARAYAIHRQLNDVTHERQALTEVIDRLPTGVMLLDGEGRVVLRNRSADQILLLDDGFRLVRDRPTLFEPREHRKLEALIADAVRAPAELARSAGGVMPASRPSGRRDFTVMVGPLVAPPPGHGMDEAKACLFVADPDGGHVDTNLVLQALYQLTEAEADLVRLIADGRSLEEVAASRGVTMNTVRSQLKQVFSKTDTNRQGELVHLVLTGVASMRGSSDSD